MLPSHRLRDGRGLRLCARHGFSRSDGDGRPRRHGHTARAAVSACERRLRPAPRHGARPPHLFDLQRRRLLVCAVRRARLRRVSAPGRAGSEPALSKAAAGQPPPARHSAVDRRVDRRRAAEGALRRAARATHPDCRRRDDPHGARILDAVGDSAQPRQPRQRRLPRLHLPSRRATGAPRTRVDRAALGRALLRPSHPSLLAVGARLVRPGRCPAAAHRLHRRLPQLLPLLLLLRLPQPELRLLRRLLQGLLGRVRRRSHVRAADDSRRRRLVVRAALPARRLAAPLRRAAARRPRRRRRRRGGARRLFRPLRAAQRVEVAAQSRVLGGGARVAAAAVEEGGGALPVAARRLPPLAAGAAVDSHGRRLPARRPRRTALPPLARRLARPAGSLAVRAAAGRRAAREPPWGGRPQRGGGWFDDAAAAAELGAPVPRGAQDA
mmetsp:Transcript_33119/g.98808  ORF Transcript_33119/g.98808 Transcript_33119/m.98808 type:complete len:439 (+) Transcript_33119:269-1585(+)